MMREKITLGNGKIAHLDDRLIFVKLNSSISSSKLSKLLEKSQLKEFKFSKKDDDQKLKINRSNHFLYLELDSVNDSELSKIKDAFKGVFEYTSNVYYTSKDVKESYFTIAANSLVVQPNVDKNDGNFIELLKKHGMDIDEVKSNYLTHSIYIQANNSRVDILDVMNSLKKSEKYVKSIYFEKIPMIVPTCSLPNDPLFSKQWNLQKVEWHKDYNQCKNEVVVAVIDEGVDLNHPDFNFSSAGINLGTMLPDGSPTGNHGTPCAGIAVGIANNSEGIAGISGQSKLLPLAVQFWSDVEIAMGINYAAKYGANVISMSFGVYDFWNYWNYDIIDPEIVYAHNQGVFMCASTGNENKSDLNRYPSKHPLVLSVGGSNKADKRKRVGDSSSEPFWGACYGLEQYQNSWVGVSVVAPCLEIPAPDRIGRLGYTSTNYNLKFNGTSAATPQVAGLAALLKAHFPKMNNIDLRKVIEKSAEKVSGYLYSHDSRFPNTSWNQEMGHGRINTRKSMALAEQLFGCTKYDLSCNCNANEVIAVSVIGSSHVSEGIDQSVAFQNLITNEGGAWINDTFIAPKKGSYYFDLNMVKDSFYQQGTEDDVTLYLLVNGTQKFSGAWSGQQSGKRSTGAFSTILNLNRNDNVKVFVQSDANNKRHISQYSLSIYKL